MKRLTKNKYAHYFQKHPIQHLFSFAIDQLVEIHTFSEKEWINLEGTFPQYLYYVIEGRAKIYNSESNGKQVLINFADAGSFIGEIELLQEHYFSKGIQTTMPTICYAFPLNACKDLLLQDTLFLRNLCIFLSKKAAAVAVRFSERQSYPLENRLAHYILLTAKNNLYTEKHTEVSDFLGVSYRHLLYVLADFCEKGILTKRGRSYEITNQNALTILANHNDYKLSNYSDK